MQDPARAVLVVIEQDRGDAHLVARLDLYVKTYHLSGLGQSCLDEERVWCNMDAIASKSATGTVAGW